MRIAFINSTRRWGGIKTWAIDLGEVAVREGHTVFVYGRDERFTDKAQALGMRSRVAGFPADFHPGSIAFFYREFQRNCVERVLVNVGRDLRTAGIAAGILGIPVIVMVGAPKDFTGSFTRRVINALLKPSYLCCSKFIADNIVKNVNYMRHARVEWVHPGTFMPEEPPRPAHTPCTFITTSQLTPPKHHADLLLGCALLQRQGRDFRLNIVGVGDQEERLRALARDNDLEDKVHFLGFSGNIGRELRQADIFILPTKAEPLGIALEEAQAHGLFPIARNSGGAPEIWPDQFRSWLLPAEAGPADFAAMLGKVLDIPPETLAAWRREVQEHARASFSQSVQFEKFFAIVESIRD